MTHAGSYNGITWGAHPVYLNVLDLDDLPALRTSDAPRAQDHGDYAGIDLLAGRVVQLGLQLVGADYAGYRALADQLRAATVPQARELPLYLEDSTRVLFCRPRKRHIPVDCKMAGSQGWADALVELYATDPRIYDATLQQAVVAIAQSSSGLTFPITFPLTFGVGVVGSGTYQVTNAGNFGSRPTAHLTGPVDNPRLEHTGSGKVIALSLSLGASDFLDIDFANRTILLNGTASRRSSLVPSSQWWELAPGLNNLRYTSGGVATGSTLTLSYRSAWI